MVFKKQVNIAIRFNFCLLYTSQQFRTWLNDQGIFSFLYMIAIIFLQIVVAFIPGEPFEIAAGYAFGFWQGTISVSYTHLWKMH